MGGDYARNRVTDCLLKLDSEPMPMFSRSKSVVKARPRSQRPFSPISALEPRLMLAGDAGTEVQAAAVSAPWSGETNSGEEDRKSTNAPLVFVDWRIDDAEVLLADLPDRAELILLSAESSGIKQITETLQARSDVSSVHLISHGGAGQIQLGRDTVDSHALQSSEQLIRGWRTSLSPDADILLYGCDVAGDESGVAFIEQLARLTDADVAASNNRTGSDREGGDWILENTIGQIESRVLVSALARELYTSTLPITIFAAGHTGAENMALQIDGNTVAEWSNIGGDVEGRAFNAYVYDNAENVSADRIRVVFTNDLYIENQIDRNLVVDRVVVDGVELQTESASVFSTGTWRPGLGIQPGNTQSEWLHGGGYFEFNEAARSAEHFVTIYAAGHAGTESMQLSIDGEVVQQWDNAGGDFLSRNFGTFVFASDTAIDANQVRVHLVDGSTFNGLDQNLIVDKVMIDGVAYEAEASDVISTGTWTAEDGIVTGFRNSEWLQATGFLQFDALTRTFDGSGNSLVNDEWGTSHAELLRVADANYADGISEPVSDLPSAREISNLVAAQNPGSVGNPEALSAMVHVWGQFIDHDMDLTEPPAEGGTALPIAVPVGDPFFDPLGTGTATINLTRSETKLGTGTSTSNPLQHENAITAFIDGSMVYGSDAGTARSLRESAGGRLLVSDGDLLPLDDEGGYQAGDIRAMENVNLTTLHTLFVREHNFWADQLSGQFPQLSDEQIFQQARKIVIGEIQAITYNEFLPALLGVNAIDAYAGYDASINPGIATEFSTAAYRFGHTMLNDTIEFMDTWSNVSREELPLADAFFAPKVIGELGIDSSIKFVASMQAQTIDNQIVDSLRNFLFGRPGSGGFDLASLNIQRGRDHGLADFNTTREAYGLSRINDFSEITSDVTLQNKLRDLYGTVDRIDLWVGGLAEEARSGQSIGETFATIIADQFERTRDGDRLWYENSLPGDLVSAINQTSLSEIISRNTTISAIQDDVFRVWGVVEGQVAVESTLGGNSGSPAANVRLQLYNGDGEFVAETRSDTQGRYSFNQIVRTGAYRVLLQLDGSYGTTGTGYEDVWFYEGNLVIGDVNFGLIENLV